MQANHNEVERVTPPSFAFQSTLKHLAIIMDGNRRWAKERNLPARDGHTRGLERAEALLQEIAHTRISHVTLFAFAQANWQRERSEVAHLFALAEEAVQRFVQPCVEHGVRIEVIGRRDRLPATLNTAIRWAERRTRRGSRSLRLAVDYSSREAILAAARTVSKRCDLQEFEAALQPKGDCPPVDLLIRTGREQRLSDFLLWECANAELYFTDTLWPDFDRESLHHALTTYATRQRRFGA